MGKRGVLSPAPWRSREGYRSGLWENTWRAHWMRAHYRGTSLIREKGGGVAAFTFAPTRRLMETPSTVG